MYIFYGYCACVLRVLYVCVCVLHVYCVCVLYVYCMCVLHAYCACVYYCTCAYCVQTVRVYCMCCVCIVCVCTVRIRARAFESISADQTAESRKKKPLTLGWTASGKIIRQSYNFMEASNTNKFQ